MMSELLRQVRVIDPVTGSDRQACDVLIVDDAIAAVAPQLTDYPADTQVKDCQGLVLGTGLVDLYSHSGEPGFEERETLATLAAAAAAGGGARTLCRGRRRPAAARAGAPYRMAAADRRDLALPPGPFDRGRPTRAAGRAFRRS